MKEAPIDAALRELKEESLGVFGDLDLTHSLVLTSCSVMTILCEVIGDVQIYGEKFDRLAGSSSEPLEIDEIRWIDQYQFTGLLDGSNGHRLYHRVRKLFERGQLEAIFSLLTSEK